MRISLGVECTITAEARAFLYTSPTPSACSMTHTHANIVDTKPSLYGGLFRFKCLRKWDKKWKFHPPLLDVPS